MHNFLYPPWPRTNLAVDENEEQFTEALSQREYRYLLIFHWFYGLSSSIFFHIFANLFPNTYQMPLNFYIFFLPLDGFSYAWELNYLLVMLMTFFMAIFFMCYVPFPLVLINQTCWLLDLTLMAVERMNLDLQLENISKPELAHKFKKHLKKLIKRSNKFVQWRSEVQDLLFWNFNLEFQIQAIILCVTTYFLSLNFFASTVVPNLFSFCLVQLFGYCWMGSRVTKRIDRLSFEVSKNWHLTQPKQRKVLQMILHRSQNMKGFTGMFKGVSLETFQSVSFDSFFNKIFQKFGINKFYFKLFIILFIRF